ncbi:hypothetical protein M427DRAFT_63912 [Gonapodya prolifera JEL478]|uniref:LysM domain-containing protein n=1 Tax=Gonapodya prolifera (strain JEL478) TaxID=1344416 RepID=A0A138ZYF5_GONPJ|nr:hypothetical protein M427DRAFT_63912 [Gonapodya prolifera JEL478]|eukprot:KXS09538.1 hypothetical protein M427DRAFT_63912 [Gonapodya prolifera JEL478]
MPALIPVTAAQLAYSPHTRAQSAAPTVSRSHKTPHAVAPPPTAGPQLQWPPPDSQRHPTLQPDWAQFIPSSPHSQHGRSVSLTQPPHPHSSPAAPTPPHSPPLSSPGVKRFVVHEVKKSDTLAGIALLYGVKISDIRSSNTHLWHSDAIHHFPSLHVPLDAITDPTVRSSIPRNLIFSIAAADRQPLRRLSRDLSMERLQGRLSGERERKTYGVDKEGNVLALRREGSTGSGSSTATSIMPPSPTSFRAPPVVPSPLSLPSNPFWGVSDDPDLDAAVVVVVPGSSEPHRSQSESSVAQAGSSAAKPPAALSRGAASASTGSLYSSSATASTAGGAARKSDSRATTSSLLKAVDADLEEAMRNLRDVFGDGVMKGVKTRSGDSLGEPSGRPEERGRDMSRRAEPSSSGRFVAVGDRSLVSGSASPASQTSPSVPFVDPAALPRFVSSFQNDPVLHTGPPLPTAVATSSARRRHVSAAGGWPSSEKSAKPRRNMSGTALVTLGGKGASVGRAARQWLGGGAKADDMKGFVGLDEEDDYGGESLLSMEGKRR